MGEMKWYVLRTAGGKEKKAKEYLDKEIDRNGLRDLAPQVLVPVKKEIIIKKGGRVPVDKIPFPGYVLIQAELNAELEDIIRNRVPGMSGFLSESKNVTRTVNGEKTVSLERVPVPIREEEAQRILGIQDKNADSEAETFVSYEIGESVRITEGPFSGFSGPVDDIMADRKKLKVIVVIFGRKTQLELDFTQVTKE